MPARAAVAVNELLDAAAHPCNADTSCLPLPAGYYKEIVQVRAHLIAVGLQDSGSSSSRAWLGAVLAWCPSIAHAHGCIPRLRLQFSKGEYPGANMFQDDLAVISTHIPRIADDHGNSIAAATAIPAGALQLLLPPPAPASLHQPASHAAQPTTPTRWRPRPAGTVVGGIIGTDDPADFFSFYTASAKSVTMAVDVVAPFGNTKGAGPTSSRRCCTACRRFARCQRQLQCSQRLPTDGRSPDGTQRLAYPAAAPLPPLQAAPTWTCC